MSKKNQVSSAVAIVEPSRAITGEVLPSIAEVREDKKQANAEKRSWKLSTIEAEIESLVKAGNVLTNNINILVNQIAMHFREHGDVAVLNHLSRFVKNLPKGIKGSSIIAWFNLFGGTTLADGTPWQVIGYNEKTKEFSYNRHDTERGLHSKLTYPMIDGRLVAWYEVTPPKEIPSFFSLADLLKLFEKSEGKAEKMLALMPKAEQEKAKRAIEKVKESLSVLKDSEATDEDDEG